MIIASGLPSSRQSFTLGHRLSRRWKVSLAGIWMFVATFTEVEGVHS
jgi:hypothetical protein